MHHNMETKFECAGIEVRIPTCRQHNEGREERLSVITTKHVQGKETHEQVIEQHVIQEQEQGTQEGAIQEEETTREQNITAEEGITNVGKEECDPLHTDTAVDKFLHQELPAFAVMSGTSPITEHRIVMHDDRPIKQRYFPKNPKMQEGINK